MIHRIFVAFIVVLSVIVSILALTLPPDQMIRLVVFNTFFQVSLPILAFGALIKYLTTYQRTRYDHHHHDVDVVRSRDDMPPRL